MSCYLVMTVQYLVQNITFWPSLSYENHLLFSTEQFKTLQSYLFPLVSLHYIMNIILEHLNNVLVLKYEHITFSGINEKCFYVTLRVWTTLHHIFRDL